MATKKVLIQVILNDQASKQIKKTGDEVQKLSSKVTVLNKEQRQQIINDEKSAIHKKNLINELKAQAAAEMNVVAAQKQGRAQSGLNNAILLETGRLASDASYGFTAMANNLGQIVTLFGSFVETNGGVVASFKELGRSIMGMGGVLIAIQLLISFGPKLLKMFTDMSTEGYLLSQTFKDVGKTVSSLSGNFETYINILQSSTQSEENKNKAIQALNKEYPEFIKNLDESGVSMENIKNNTKDANEQINLQRKAILELAKSRAATDKIQEVQTEIINKQIERERELISVGAESMTQDQMRAEADKIAFDEFTTDEERRRYSTLQRLADNKEEHDEFIKNKKEEIDLLSEYVKVEIGRTKGSEDQKKYSKLIVDNFDREIQAIKDLGRIRKQFFEKNLQQDVKDKETEEDKIDLLRTQALARVDAIQGGEVAKRQARLEINTYYDKLEEEAEEKKELKLQEIRNKYQLKTLKVEEDTLDDPETQDELALFEEKQLARVAKEEELAILALDKLKLSTEDKEKAVTDIENYYAAVRLKNKEDNQKTSEKIDELETKSKLEALDNIGKGLMSASNIAGKATGVGKALAVAGTLVSTYSAAQKAYESQMQLTPDSPIRAKIAAATAVLSGLANVKAILSVKSPAMKETSAVTGGQGNVQVQAPDFNVVGQGGVNQLGQVIGAQFGQPLRAYVVSGDISTAQELDRSITTGATIG
jgi:hypothetical protein